MKIIVEYDSCWRNSFLEGNNNEPMLKKEGRKFIGSMTNLRKAENYIERAITNDTVMGVLNRLIGDQRKLYQARAEQYGSYYFKDIDPAVGQADNPVISYMDQPLRQTITKEMTYIRNMTGSTDQNSFTGIIKAHDVMFSSDYSPEFWGVLGLDFEQLCDFIIDKKKVQARVSLNPITLAEIGDNLKKMNLVENTGIIAKIVKKLTNKYPELTTEKVPTPYIEKSGMIKPERFYAAALYLQYERLQKYFDMSSAISSRGTISGFSKRGFNGKRDFITKFTTGKAKTIWGNPYIRKERIKGEGEVISMMTKASGTLEITLDIDRNRARYIKKMIEDAGVSSFYLGKKGLAYVSDITTREVRK